MHALLFRAIGILRPALLLIVVRSVSLEDARVYAAILSRYVIGTEIYNLLFPTDGLYKKGATVGEAAALAVHRLRIAAPVWLASLIVLVVLSGDPVQSLMVSCASLLSALAVPFYGYAFPRLPLRRTAFLECAFHLLAAGALALWLVQGSLWPVLVFTLLEMPLKGVAVVLMDRTALAAGMRAAWRSRPHRLGRAVLDGVKTGFPITLANYFFRIPFAVPLPSGVLDPLFLLCAQAINALYNLVLVVHAERVLALVRRLSAVSLALGLLLALIALASGHAGRLDVQFVIVGAFALPYAVWLSALSGAGGLLCNVRYRLAVIAGLGAVLGVAAALDPGLVWLVFLFPCSYFLTAKINERYAKG
jgi:hypothetical protein